MGFFNNNDDDDAIKNWLEPTDEDLNLYKNTNTISGIGIENIETEEEDSASSLDDLLKGLNAQNYESHKEEQKRLLEEEASRLEEERRRREEEHYKRLAIDAEEEAKERERIRLEEEEEERRLAEEMEARRKANPLYKIKDSTILLANKGLEKSKEFAEKSRLEKEKKAEENRIKKEELERQKQEDKESALKNQKEKSAKPQKEAKQIKEPKIAKEKEIKIKETPKKKKSNLPDFEYLATHDQLTGLKNTTAYELFTENLSSTKDLAIIFFDINDLKVTNDTKGHAAGDKLITTVANIVKDSFGDNAYRVGGDEFVVIYKGSKKENIEKTIEDKIASIRAKLVSIARNDKDHLLYSVAIGYEIGTEDKGFEIVRALADKKMYENKKSIKGTKDKKKQNVKKEPEYDSLLTENQRTIKKQVQQGHSQTPINKTEQIIREIQAEYANIYTILLTDKSFDNLFIMQDIDNFLDLVMENDYMIDYSYLYVILEKGTRFYGVDEYSDDIQSLFENIGSQIRDMLIRTGSVSNREIQKVKGINIFKNLYIG